jgi:hypothetical protein
MDVQKVKHRDAYDKYYVGIRLNDFDRAMITTIAVKAIDPDNLVIDSRNKTEAREKQWWFNKMFANK